MPRSWHLSEAEYQYRRMSPDKVRRLVALHEKGTGTQRFKREMEKAGLYDPELGKLTARGVEMMGFYHGDLKPAETILS